MTTQTHSHEPLWRRELRYFFTALMYFTRLPCPRWVGYSEFQLAQSRTYFSLMGYVIAAICFVVYAITQAFLPLQIAVILSMCASVFATGAFHEDGFADVCDSFGGGYGKNQIMTIMKDSRVGAYGVIGMILILLLKYELLVILAQQGIWFFGLCLLLAHSASRLAASITVQLSDYVQDIEQSKSKPIATMQLSHNRLMFSVMVVLTPFLLLLIDKGMTILFLPILPIMSQYALMRYFIKHIGGYTGDCLGTIQQVCEIAVYVSIIALCISI